MYLCYDESVKVGLNTYRTLEYEESSLYVFKLASKEFKKYIEDANLPYSPVLVQQWVNDLNVKINSIPSGHQNSIAKERSI